jgi:rhodanese-related sulfurtransferase
MRIEHPLARAVSLVIASLVIAVIANGFSGRTRQLKLPGWYPHALRVPPKEQPAPKPIAAPAPAPVPVTTTAATIAVPTTTTVAQTTTEQPSNRVTQQPQEKTQQPLEKKTDLSKFTPHPDKPYVEITGDDASALHSAGVLFLDARRSSIYEEGHIAGARSFSVWEADVDDKVNALFEERGDPAEQNKPIVIYCSGGACEDSHMLSQKLWGVQFNNIYVYKDGYPDWIKRRLPTRTGATP